MIVLDFLDELRWRGLLHQSTDLDGLRTHLAGARRRAYIGFDPTADSLTIGNLVPILLLAHFQRAGHEPIVLMGGGTGLIGDPSGKSAERQLLTADAVDANVTGQRRIFDATLPGATVVNNVEWLGELGYLEALRDIGKHFSVNVMIARDSVKERLHGRDHGISYTEFSYMVLQAYDFARLHQDRQVSLQMGGSDQWGNIVAGVDLTRRLHGAEVFGLTTPLVTKSDGGKFGKSEAGAVWLTADRTSVYAFHQFWRNVDDADVVSYLKRFTFLSREEIDALEAEHLRNPGARQAQQALADAVTTWLHGAEACGRAQGAASALFSGDVRSLDERTLTEVVADVPSSEHPRQSLVGGVELVGLLVETGLATSRRQAREFLENGSVAVNGERAALDTVIGESDLLHGTSVLVRRGKKNWHVTRWV